MLQGSLCQCIPLGILHFGHASISRVESAYAALKKWIGTSTGDLLCVNTVIKLAYEGQLRVIQQQNAHEWAVADANLLDVSSIRGKIFTCWATGRS